MTQFLISVLQDSEWQKTVLDKDLSTPPPLPNKGDRYIVGSSPSGTWTGQEGNIVWYDGSHWEFAEKFKGMVVYVKDEMEWYCYIDSWQLFILKDYYTESLGESSTTSSYAIYVNKLILNVTPKAGNYIFEWNFKITSSNAGYDVWSKVWDGINIYSEARINCSIVRANTGWEERSGFIKLAVSGNRNFYIDFCRNTSGTAYVKDAKLLLRRIG